MPWDVLFCIVPPEALLVWLPSPVIVKLPEVLDRTMPSAPPFAETLVSETARGVVPLLRVIWTAGPVAPELMAPLVVVIVPELSVETNPLLFDVVLVTLSAAKVIVPVLVVRLTPVLPELVMVVEPVTEKLPALVSRVIPVVELFVEVRLCRITSIVPLLRFSARPEPLLIVVSRTFNVP